MQKFLIAIILTFSHATSHGQVQPASTDTLKVTLSEVFNTVKKFSVYRRQVNWEELEATILFNEPNTLSLEVFKQRIQQLFSTVGDVHGALFLNNERIGANNMQSNTISDKFVAQLRQSNIHLHTTTIGKIGYLLIPSNSSNENLTILAQAIQDSLCSLIAQPLDGIIIDLRANEGGSIYPLFSGMHQLIGDGDFGAFTDLNGERKDKWTLRRGQLHQRKRIVASVKSRCQYPKEIPVAVLLSPITASAGEMLAIAMRGRKNTIFIGEKTYGLTTGISTFRIQNNILAVATSFSADRKGKIYRGSVSPDIEVVGGDDFNRIHKDAKVLTALKWFSSTKSR
ncbi:MAG TPA: S41 family peptidase [Flavisolibacter sp.]|nr:S41 family peptidase [Flavisolibacter sp.]